MNSGTIDSPKARLPSGLTASPVNDVNGVNQNGGIWFDGQPADRTVPDLPALLANEAGIDINRILAERLSDTEWSALLAAHARLAARLPTDERARLRALVAQIDAAGQAVAL